MVDTVRPKNVAAGWDRRTFLRASGLTVGGLSLAGLIAACGGRKSLPTREINPGRHRLVAPFVIPFCWEGIA